MLFLSYASFFGFLTCIFMGISGLVFDPKSKLNRAFIILTLILSLWAVIPSVLIVVIMAFRILDEENYLRKNLNGYSEYCIKTKYRLIPFIW